MKQIPQTALVFAVFVLGFLAALPFQRTSETELSRLPVQKSESDFVLRRDIPLQLSPETDPRHGVPSYWKRNANGRPPAVTQSPKIRNQLVPVTPRRSAEPSEPYRDRAHPPRRPSGGNRESEPFHRPPGTESRSETSAAGWHRIVDGDSLTALAQRYLGDRGRYLDLYEANQDILARPDVLPIGVRIRIPSATLD